MIDDLMNKNLLSVDINDSITKAMDKMIKARVHQLIVFDGKEYMGMLVLKEILHSGCDSSCALKSIMKYAEPVDVNASVENVAEKLLSSGMRALPVLDDGKMVGVISESDLVQAVNEGDVDKLSSGCVTIDINENIGGARSVMHKNNVSRLVVLNNGNVEGVIDIFGLVEAYRGEKAMQDSEGRKERKTAEEMNIQSFMREVNTKNGIDIKKAVSLLSEREEVIIDNGELGIITPKDLVELLVPAKDGVLVRINNLKDEDEVDVDKVYASVEEFIKKSSKMFKGIDFFNIHVDRHDKGGRTRYDIRTRFGTNIGVFNSKADGWKFVPVAHDSIKKLQREVEKKRGRQVTHAKRRGQSRKNN